MVRIAVLASGSGTNAQRLVEHFRAHPLAEVAVVGCDRPTARVVQRAWDLGVPCLLFNGARLRSGEVQRDLIALHIDLIVLAGFLRLVPPGMVRAWPDRIVNIHPALLPRHGGRGMFGEHVHKAVIAAGETESGITIHLVNERYDEGRHLLQARCAVLVGDTPATLAQRVHALEHEHYPRTVEGLVRSIQ
jgi:phosphoribosylglycinamide formyltransferase-1